MSPSESGKVARPDLASASKIHATREPSPEERNEMIRVAAYYIAERDGFKGGDAAYWATAEHEINIMFKLCEGQDKLQNISSKGEKMPGKKTVPNKKKTTPEHK